MDPVSHHSSLPTAIPPPSAQLSFALQHASALEASHRAHDALAEQAEALRQAEMEGKSAVKARDNFLQARGDGGGVWRRRDLRLGKLST